MDTLLDTTDPGDGLLSLREALVLANADADKDEIQFADAIAGKTLVLTQGALRIEADLLIDGPPSGFTIDGDGKSGVLSIYKVGGPGPDGHPGRHDHHRRQDHGRWWRENFPPRPPPPPEHGHRQSRPPASTHPEAASTAKRSRFTEAR